MVKKENIRNVPNSVTSARVVLTVVIIFLYFIGTSILNLLVVFIIAAFTDFLDGFLARRLKQETLFGAKFDMLADRFLWVTFGLILLFGYTEQGYYNIVNFVLIFSREIFSTIFLIFYFIFSKERNIVPQVRYGGKLVTLLQAIAIPSMILSDYFQGFEFYELVVFMCGFFGTIAALYYMIDVTIYRKYRKHKMIQWLNCINPIAPALNR